MNEEYEDEVVDSALDTTDEEEPEAENFEDEEAPEVTEKPKETPEQRQARLRRQAEREAKRQGITVEEYLGISKPSKLTKAPKSEAVPEWGQKILLAESKRTFQHMHNLAPDTVDAVFRANGGEAPTDEQMESDEVIKAVVSTFQSKARRLANTPSGGSIPTYKGKTYSEIVTNKESTKEDKQAAFEATRKKHGIK